MKSLRESFIPQKRATEAFHYPGYVIRLQKEQQIHAKTMSPNQLNIKLITKNNKKSLFSFFAGDNICKSNDARFCDTVKNLQKRANLQKSQKLVLRKLVVPRRKTICGK